MAGLGPLEIIALAAIGLVLLVGMRWILRREGDRQLRGILLAGVLAKVVGAVIFYRVLTDVYGTGDASRYFRVGLDVAETMRSGSLPAQAREPGTPFMEFLTGVVIVGTGPNLVAVYAVFSMLALLGLYLFILAYRVTVPEGNHRRYALLVLLLPTIVFWTATISKEAWLIFCLGMGAYGAARLLRGHLVLGSLAVVVGTAGVFVIRPHMAALFVLSFAVAYLLRVRDRTARWGQAGWAVGFVVVALGSGVVAVNYGQAMSPIGASDDSGLVGLFDHTDELLEQTERQTRTGASEFDSRPVENPADFVHALVTVPFRPFPHETHNATAQIASLEGLLLLGLVLLALPQLVHLPRILLRYPFVAGAFVYTVGFIIAFSNVGNFGLLTRQRSQLLPFLLILLALPRQRDHRGRRSAPPLVLTTPQAATRQVGEQGEPRQMAASGDDQQRLQHQREPTSGS